MKADEFRGKEDEILSSLPIEFRAAVSRQAYQLGHSSGCDEVLIYLREMVGMLEDPIEAYTTRIRKEAKS